MPISESILAFLSYLLLVGSACAHVQVSAPNCPDSDSTFAWVGSLHSDARFVSITIRFSHRTGVFIVVQFAPTMSLLGHSILVSDMQQWWSVHAPLARDQVRPTTAIYANATRSYICNSGGCQRLSETSLDWSLTASDSPLNYRCIQPHKRMRCVPGRVVDSVR